MFMAEVLSINADEKYIDEKGAFDISKCDLIAYANGGYYKLGLKVGKFGYSVENKVKAKDKKVVSRKETKKTNKEKTLIPKLRNKKAKRPFKIDKRKAKRR